MGEGTKGDPLDEWLKRCCDLESERIENERIDIGIFEVEEEITIYVTNKLVDDTVDMMVWK